MEEVEMRGMAASGPYAVMVARRDGGAVFWRGDVAKTKLALDNLEIGRDYIWTVTARTADGELSATRRFATEARAPRLVRLDHVRNVRDLGGLVGLDGRRIRQGRLFRSAGLNDKWDPPQGRLGKMFLSRDGRRYAKDVLGIRTDLDLRTDDECHGMTASPLGEGVRWAHVSAGCYGELAEEKGRAAFAACFRLLLDETNYPVVFHCVAGADRTGSLAFVLEALLGVDEEAMSRDWALTALCHRKATFQPTRYDALLKVFDALPGETLHARVAAWVKSCGFTDADLAHFRALMLESAPPRLP